MRVKPIFGPYPRDLPDGDTAPSVAPGGVLVAPAWAAFYFVEAAVAAADPDGNPARHSEIARDIIARHRPDPIGRACIRLMLAEAGSLRGRGVPVSE